MKELLSATNAITSKGKNFKYVVRRLGPLFMFTLHTCKILTTILFMSEKCIAIKFEQISPKQFTVNQHICSI